MNKAKKSDQNRRTPPWLFEAIQKRLKVKFKLDAAADHRNALCKKFYSEADDALTKVWADKTYCNPPFKKFGWWMGKAYGEAFNHRFVVCVVGPAGCAQSWFHEYARLGTIFAPNDRVVYYSSDKGQPTHGADRDTMVYVFGPGWWNPDRTGKTFHVLPLDIKGQVVKSKLVRPR